LDVETTCLANASNLTRGFHGDPMGLSGDLPNGGLGG
jgi:hypothetical protein